MIRGRGVTRDVASRFEALERIAEPWADPGFEPERQVPTTVIEERARSIITTNGSPDVPFRRSINPYAGCEHGCIYCFARPCHGYRDMGPGLEFETRIVAKVNAPELLTQALERPGYRPEAVALGASTDPYQPVETRLRLTRRILEVLAECRHPTVITTKSATVLRDLDLLTALARVNAVRVCVSVTTLDARLARLMEPRASTPARRLEAVRTLVEAGVPTALLASPMIPAINDHELEAILEAGAAAGAARAGIIAVRLPWEVAPLFEGWLESHFPERKAKVLNQIRAMRGGDLYDASFDQRMRGRGPLADLLWARFGRACRRLGLDDRDWALDAGAFRRPGRGQLSLFDGV